jgi:hypothetical protein
VELWDGQQDKRTGGKNRGTERHEYKKEEKDMQGSEDRHAAMPSLLSQNSCVSLASSAEVTHCHLLHLVLLLSRTLAYNNP